MLLWQLQLEDPVLHAAVHLVGKDLFREAQMAMEVYASDLL